MEIVLPGQVERDQHLGALGSFQRTSTCAVPHLPLAHRHIYTVGGESRMILREQFPRKADSIFYTTPNFPLYPS